MSTGITGAVSRNRNRMGSIDGSKSSVLAGGSKSGKNKKKDICPADGKVHHFQLPLLILKSSSTSYSLLKKVEVEFVWRQRQL